MARQPSPPLHPSIRRALWRLGTAYALAWLTISIAVGPGSTVVVDLSGRLDAAGWFIAAYYLGAAAGGALFGRGMDRWGRRPLLVAAYGTAAAGFALAGTAIRAESLAMFLAGVVGLAAGMGGLHLTRVAAAEMFPPAGRGRAVGRIQLAALAGALAGPLLLALSGRLDALPVDPVRSIWLAAVPVLGAALLIVTRAPETQAIARDLSRYHPSASGAGAPRATSFQRRPLATGVASLALANAAMVMAMGVTGAALRHEGHGASAVGLALAAHFLGMFGLSPLVGRLTDRLGRRATILAGFFVLALGGALIAAQPGVSTFSAGIFLVGLGWSGAYIGGTVLVTDATPADRSARVLGLTDMATAVVTIAASIGGGAWYAGHGLPGLGLAAVAIILLPAALVTTLREPRPGVYGAPVRA
jgi:MFS family permease